MARPIAVRQTLATPFRGPLPEQVAVQLKDWLGAPAAGIDLRSAPDSAGPQVALVADNWDVERGQWISRPGTVVLGATSADTVQVVEFVDSADSRYLVRFRQTGVDLYNDSLDLWTDLGITLHGSEGNHFAYTSWADKLIFSNGIEGMWELDPRARTAVRIPTAPAARQLNTFGQRIIASGTEFAYRVRWCAAGNNRRWNENTDIGAGYEDLFSTPGGEVDEIMGTYSLTDDTAIMVRARSLYEVRTTGNPDAPFIFARLPWNVGSPARRSICLVPGGIIFLGNDDVYAIVPQGNQQVLIPGLGAPQSLGEAIRYAIYARGQAIQLSAAAFDFTHRRYALAIRQLDRPGEGLNCVYRFSTLDKAWTVAQYPFGLRSIAATHYNGLVLTVAQLVGMVGELQGVVADLGVLNPGVGTAMVDTTGRVIREDALATRDLQPLIGPAPTTETPSELRTGTLRLAEAIEDVTLMELWLDVIAEVAQTLAVDVSTDLGATWTPHGTWQLRASATPQRFHLARPKQGLNVQVRLRGLSLGRTRIVRFQAGLTRGVQRD